MPTEIIMKKRVLMIASFLIWLGILGSPARGNGLNLNSLGTRALSMGGAFVGLADDFSAVFWNPAGAAGFRTERLGFFGTDLMPKGRYRLDAPAGSGAGTLVDARSKISHYLGGMLAYYRPVSDNLVLGIGVYTPSGGGSDWTATDFTAIAGGKAYEWSNTVGILSISPLAAWKISEKIWIGATLNINHGTFSLNMPAGKIEIPVDPYVFDLGQYEETMGGWGLGATLGFMVKPSEQVSFGLTFRTPSTIRFKGDAQIPFMALLGLSGASDLERSIKFPAWIAGGIAVRPMDRLILTADLQWTGWGTMDEMRTVFADAGWRDILRASGGDVRKMDWSDRIQVRFGAEYSLNDAFALRAGYYHDPSPAPDTTMTVLIPSLTYEVLTAGVGWDYGGLRLDFGLEYLAGKGRTIDPATAAADPAYAAAMPGRYKMRFIVPNLSVGFRF